MDKRLFVIYVVFLLELFCCLVIFGVRLVVDCDLLGLVDLGWVCGGVVVGFGGCFVASTMCFGLLLLFGGFGVCFVLEGLLFD